MKRPAEMTIFVARAAEYRYWIATPSENEGIAYIASSDF